MEVGQVIAAHQGDGPGRVHLGRGERGAVQVQLLDDPDAGQLGDTRPMAAADRAKQDGDLLAVIGGQFLDHPVGQRVVPADDQVARALWMTSALWVASARMIRVLGDRAGDGRHGEI